jgi:hypothetical protein
VKLYDHYWIIALFSKTYCKKCGWDRDLILDFESVPALTEVYNTWMKMLYHDDSAFSISSDDDDNATQCRICRKPIFLF